MNSKYKYINKYKTYIIHSLIFGLVLLGVYFLTQVGVPYNGIELFIRKSIVCILASFIVQAVVGHPLFSRKSIPSAIVFLTWILVKRDDAVWLSLRKKRINTSD